MKGSERLEPHRQYSWKWLQVTISASASHIITVVDFSPSHMLEDVINPWPKVAFRGETPI